jgi:MYXO-CTERM domain-containing protein
MMTSVLRVSLVALTIGWTGLPAVTLAQPNISLTMEAMFVGTSGGQLGTSVAITTDGSRVVAGAPLDGPNGTASVYVRSGTSWTLEQSLAGTSCCFGRSVAIAGDGTRLLVGRPEAGAADVFARSGSTWTLEQTLTDGMSGTSFGRGVAMNGDGSRVIIGGPMATVAALSGVGEAVVFVRSGTTWAVETSINVPITASSSCGASVAMSQDGATVVIGCPGQSLTVSFTRSGTTWTHVGNATSTVATSGTFVATSGDGLRGIASTAIASGPSDQSIIFATGQLPASSSAFTGVGPGVFDHSGNRGIAVQIGSPPTAMAFYERMLTVYGGPPTSLPGTVPMVGAPPFGAALSDDGSRAIVGAYTADTVVIYRLVGSNSVPCSTNGECANGFCSDGVCCDSACGASNPSDCMACTQALTGMFDGTCAALANPTAVACHTQTGPCDRTVSCVASSTVCPAFYTPGVTCRAASGTCDVAEICDGTSGACPPDGFAMAGIPCHVSTGACDPAASCNGTSPSCPAMLSPAGTVCRASVGGCDIAETCSGSDPSCPADAFMTAGAVCHTTLGVCDTTTRCSGTGAMCPPSLVSGVVCRPAMGGCDTPESCTGADPSCPPDAVLSSGIVCRGSTDPSCDPAEHCDGTTTSCPPDVDHCATMADTGVPIDAHVGVDAGTQDGSTRDAASTADATTATAPAAGSCACGVASRAPSGVALLSLLGLALVRRRRTSARC